MPPAENLEQHTVHGFGREWTTFDHAEDREDMRRMFESYLAVFPWDRLPKDARGLDLGCGSGRWARYVAPRVGSLVCLDAAEDALAVARKNLATLPNVQLVHSTIERADIPDSSLDFAYSLGVLHHTSDTEAALRRAVEKLKPGAPMLLYLYYALDNRSPAFRAVWRASDLLRQGISRMPYPARLAVSEVLARTVYWPLARGAALGEKLGLDVSGVPLSSYRHMSLYVMRNDSLDRFGTKLEKRYSRVEMKALMERAGLTDVRFHEGIPYWCAVGHRAR